MASGAARAAPWVVLVVLLAGFGVYEYRQHQTSSDAGTAQAIVTPTASGVDGVVTGDLPVAGGCYETQAGSGPASDVTPIPKPCDGLHNTYVVAHVPYPDPKGTAYDQQAVVDEGHALCKTRDDAYIGQASTAKFTYVSIYPSEDDWTSGGRTAVCMVRREGADVVGPLTQ